MKGTMGIPGRGTAEIVSCKKALDEIKEIKAGIKAEHRVCEGREHVQPKEPVRI